MLKIEKISKTFNPGTNHEKAALQGLSLLENAAYIGLPIPDKLKEILEQLHDRKDKEHTDNTTDQGDGE